MPSKPFKALARATQTHLIEVFGPAITGNPSDVFSYNRVLEFLARREGFATYAAYKRAEDRRPAGTAAAAPAPESPAARTGAVEDMADGPVFVVEIPHLMPARVWRAESKADFIARVREAAQRTGDQIYDASTPATLLRRFGHRDAAEASAEGDGWVVDLAARYGWDRPVFSGYGVGGDGPYTDVDPGEFQSHANWLGHDLSACHVLVGYEAAIRGCDEISGHQGARAEALLREALMREASYVATNRADDPGAVDITLSIAHIPVGTAIIANDATDWADLTNLDSADEQLAPWPAKVENVDDRRDCKPGDGPTLTYRIEDLAGRRLPLYEKLPGRLEPQEAFVLLTDDGVVQADTSGASGNGVPPEVYHGRDLRLPVAPSVDGDALVRFLNEPGTRALLERLHAGHWVERDAQGNRVGQLTRDAQDARDEIESRLLALTAGDRPVWDVADWLFDAQPLEALWAADRRFEDVVGELEREAAEGDERVFGSIAGALRKEVRDRVDRRDLRLTRAQVENLVAAGVLSREEADDYLDETSA